MRTKIGAMRKWCRNNEDDAVEDAVQRPTNSVWCGGIIFCTTCGAYAESKSVKLKGDCSGKPKFDGSYGGAWGQHKKLMNGRHPRSNELLPSPKRADGTLWKPGAGSYNNLKSTTAGGVDPKFYRYEPVPDRVLIPQVRAKSVQLIQAERLSMVRKRQAECDTMSTSSNGNECKRRRLRSKGPEVRG